MITIYQWAEDSLFSGVVEVDEIGPMPERSTPTKPPKLTGTQVAQWCDGWVILSSAPESVLPLEPNWPSLIAARRYTVETSGITFQGTPIDTRRDGQALITGASVAAMLDPEYAIRWKTTAGFVELSGQQILSLASAVRAHVQASFDREAQLLAAVADGSITAAMLEEGWPV
jgi:hypothetical protein